MDTVRTQDGDSACGGGEAASASTAVAAWTCWQRGHSFHPTGTQDLQEGQTQWVAISLPTP
jgi:hypothetical protein